MKSPQRQELNRMATWLAWLGAAWLTLSAPGVVMAQPITWLDNRPPDHEVLNLSNGLSDSTIFSVDQDALGRVWFGTASGGVNVFDGHRVRVFVNEPDPESLSHSGAGQVFTDSRGTVYVGTWGGGLNRLVSADGRFERINPNSAPLMIQTMFEDDAGRIWIGTSGDGLMLFDQEDRFTPTLRRDGAALERVWSITQSSEGRLWVAADAGLFEITDELTLAPVETTLDEQPRALATTDGRLWIGGDSALHSLSLVTGSTQRLSAKLPTINVLQDAPDGRLMIGTLAGLYAVDPASNDLVSPVGDSNLRLFPDRNIRDIDFDRTGMIWLATREAGVIRLVGQQTGYQAFATDEKLETVDTLVELGPDELLLGSRRGLWRLLRTESGPLLEHVTNSQSLFVNQLAAAHGRVYVGARSGLRIYDPAANQLSSDPKYSSFDGVSVTAIHPAPDETVWIGTWSRGLFRVAPDGEITRYWSGGSPALPDDYLSAIVPDSDGGLWLGHWWEGLSRLVPATGDIERFQASREHSDTLTLGHVHSAVIDDTSVWIGTSFGFARLDLSSREVQRIPLAAESVPVSVQRLELDHDGHVWIATNRGIKRFEPGTGELVHYGSADGLATTEFYARSGTRGTTGALYFGGVGGLIGFDPDVVADRFAAPEVFVTQAWVDGDPMALAEGTIEVPAGTRELRFEVAAADFKDAKENRYQFRMIGDDPEWSEPSPENDITFAALPPDTYRFEARASNSNGVWSEAAAGVDVTVRPFWWQTLIGRMAIVLALGLAAYAWLQVRLSSVKAANRKLEGEVERQTRDLQRANERLAKAAATDFLTGLPNRRGFFVELESNEDPVTGTLALADIDDFKAYNDHFGHEAGDLVLKRVADVLASVIRPQDLVARWGGEEFVFYFGGIGVEEAAAVAERVRKKIADSQLASSTTKPISITVGIAERRDGESLDRCIDRADQLLYAGKQSGKNRVVKAA